MNLSERFKNPKDEASKSAKFIGLGILSILSSLVVFFAYIYFLKFTNGKAGGTIFLIQVVISGLGSILATFLMLVGTVLGFHSVYRLKKQRERLGLAWVSIFLLPLTLLLLLMILVPYHGP
jgi:hypothetical protein